MVSSPRFGQLPPAMRDYRAEERTSGTAPGDTRSLPSSCRAAPEPRRSEPEAEYGRYARRHSPAEPWISDRLPSNKG